MILRILLTDKSAGLEAFVNLFGFAFAKGEFLAPALKPPDPVLSVGCGMGQVEARGHTVTGVDPSPDMVAAARILAEREGTAAGNPCFVEAAGTALPFSDGSFGSVLYLSSLHEMGDRGANLAEARRVLTPAGMMLVGEDETTWHRVPLAREIGQAGFDPAGEHRLPEVFNHGRASAYVVRHFVRTELGRLSGGKSCAGAG